MLLRIILMNVQDKARRVAAVIVPALNEEKTVGSVVEGCFSALEGQPLDAVVIVIDDGSEDRTAEIARSSGARVVSHTVTTGLGKALQTGLDTALRSGAEVLINIDADGQFDTADIPRLIAPILGGRADFVSASRFKDPGLVPDMPRVKIWGNRFMSWVISSITGRRLYDVSCGFRAYTRETALRLNLWSDFTYTQESFLDLYVKGMRIEELPLKVRGEREHGKSRIASNLVHYGWRTMNTIVLAYRDYWPMRFFGVISATFLLPGALLLLFFVWHRIDSGQFSPHIWAGFTGAALTVLGLLVGITGMLADMLKRIRINQETILYHHKKTEYDGTRQ